MRQLRLAITLFRAMGALRRAGHLCRRGLEGFWPQGLAPVASGSSDAEPEPATMPRTDTQRDIVTAAAQHPERLACPPRRVPTGARQSVAKALLRQGLVISAANSAHDATAA